MRPFPVTWLGLALVLMTAAGCERFPERDESPGAASRPLSMPPGMTTADRQGKAGAPDFSLPSIADIPERDEIVTVDPSHPYTLAELIDLAQRSNPDTRIAWERARQAALAVGVVEASYLPQLAAEVLGGYQRTPLPIPKTVVPRGYFTATTEEVFPGLLVQWLLFDFGRRDAMFEGVRQLSLAADIGFTGAHQKLIFEVAKAYFAVDAERAQRRVAESALKNALILDAAVQAKRARGLATVPETAKARRNTAKARFDLERAKAADNDVYHALLEAIGLTPTLKMELADSGARQLPKTLGETADSLIRRALARRPDIAGALAKLKASEAGISAARADYYPTLGLEGTLTQNIGGVSLDGGQTYRINEPAAGILFRLKLPLYDGGSRDSKLAIARSKKIEATEELAKARDEAVRQIARAYDTLTSALAQCEAADTLVAASETAAQAAFDDYRQGVGTFTAASSADTDRAQALSARARAHADALTAAAALAFVTGELTSSTALEMSTPALQTQ